MVKIVSMSKTELQSLNAKLSSEYEGYKARNLKLDMSRGVPGVEQLDLSEGLLTCVKSSKDCIVGKIDTRNYGALDGIPEAKNLFAQLLEVDPENVIVGGNSSLNMMYDTICRAMTHGVYGGKSPWAKLPKVKFLCPSPGYDRHFSICEHFGIEMITVDMTPEGPDMDAVEAIVSSDPAVKGIWCVPKYSNPEGITYSDRVVRRFAALKPAAEDFRIFWDNAYIVHDLYDNGDKLLNIFDACKELHSEDMIFEYCSTSKITFPGAGVAAMAASSGNIETIKKQMFYQTICPDKLNQLRHCVYFHDVDGIRAQMKKHAALLRPKFEMVTSTFERELAHVSAASYHKPNGGYFISLDVMPGCAKRTLKLMADVGVALTPAGSTYPYKNDPWDKNIRISPTYPKLNDLKTAMELLCVCVKLAEIEKLRNA